MNNKKILFLIILGFFSTVKLIGQSLNPTSSISALGSANTFKEGYTFAYATSGTPWNGSLISYGGLTNQYDCQISSDYYIGNHISFRTKNGETNTWNPWNELATKGTNNFIGDQNIDGNVGIGTINPQNKLSVIDTSGNQFIASYTGGSNIYQNYKYTALSYGESINYGNAANLGYMSHQIDKSLSGLYFTNYGESEILASLFIKAGGNIGIGTINPKNKLDVNGTIHSKEVKVDMNGWSDFVFKKEYNLPTLEEVEKHIAQKGHLENIPSEKEVLKDGINLGEMNSKLLQKIEELTLYMIEQNKRMTKMEKENDILKNNQTQLQKTIIELTRK